QRLHPAAAGPGYRGAGRRRPLYRAPPRQQDTQPRNRQSRFHSYRALARHRSQAREPQGRARRHGRRSQVGYGAPGLRRHQLPGRRQDRHGTGLQFARRQVQRGGNRRAPARPCPVHGLRARGESTHRTRPDRRERRLGLDRGRAHRAHGLRLLARPRAGGRARTAHCPREGRLMKILAQAALKALRSLDWPLLAILVLMTLLGLTVMHSAVGGTDWRFADQSRHFLLAFFVLWIVAVIPLPRLMQLAPWFYSIGVLLLLGVEFFGETSKGATRWLDLGIVRIQPSE